MDLLRKAQRNVGSGLRGTGRRDLLADVLEEERLAKLKSVPVTVVTYPEPAEIRAWVDSDTQRPAFMKNGEIIPYTPEEIAEKKDSEFAHGTKLHVFRGTLRPGTTVRDGPGSLHYASGDCYVGSFRNHHKSGAGVFLSPTGYSVEGSFVDDQPHGRCLERYPGGDVYWGDFVGGVPHGWGVLFYERNGSRYEGGFEVGEKHGVGVVFYRNGDVFQGSWRRGMRQGYGVTTYAATKRSYASNWADDKAEFATSFVANVSVPTSNVPPLTRLASPLGSDIRTMQPLPDMVAELHPTIFLRIKAAFEALDSDCCGEIDLAHLRSQWLELGASDGSDAVPNESFAAFRLENSSALLTRNTSMVSAASQLKNGELLVALQRASQNGVTLNVAEVLGVLVPRLPEVDLRRALTTDLTPETILRLRGVLGGVVAKHADTFTALSEPSATQRHVPGGGHQNHPAAPVVTTAASPGRAASPGGGRAGATTGGGATKGGGVLVVTLEKLQANRHVVGGLKVSPTAFLRAAAVDGTPHGEVTFPQLLRQLFPHLPVGAAERCEVDHLPIAVLRQYARDFDALDVLQQHHLGIERLKASQRRWQLHWAGVGPEDEQRQRADAFTPPTSRAPGSPSMTATDALDRAAVPGFWRHTPVWLIGDLELTVGLAKLVDRHRTGWVSLLDVLRFCFPNVPCLATRERLGQAVRAEDQCGCVLCGFCGDRYVRPRPPSPYVDGTVTW